MKKIILIILIFVFSQKIWAQDSILFDWDIDSIFESDETEDENEITDEYETSPVLSLIRRPGFSFRSSYEASAFAAPGWDEYPWLRDGSKWQHNFERGILLSNTITLDAQISEIFRIVSTFSISVPPAVVFTLGNFYFDYNFYNKLFVRAGKFDMAWGISPNFGFTNLLARVSPDAAYIGESYIFKADYPVRNGGLQALALTRGNPQELGRRDFGYGVKYNIALPQADFDFGFFYHALMPFRGFLSVKKTIWKIEFYTEGLIAVDFDNNYDLSGAANFGFARSFFNDNLSVNGELFFNGEKNTYLYQSKTDYKEAAATAIIEEFTIAFNLSYKLWHKINLKFLTGVLYAPQQESAHITPGFTCNPIRHMEIALAFPTAVGSKTGYYRTHTPRWAPGNVPLPFAVYFHVKLSGGVGFSL